MGSKLPFISDAFQRALSGVSIYTAFLEHMAEHTIDELLDEQRHLSEFLLRRAMSGDRVIELLEAILLDIFPNESEPIKITIAGIKQTRKEKNDLFHGLLYGSDDPAETITSKHMRPHRERREVSKTITEIETLTKHIIGQTDLLMHWRQMFRERKLAALRAKYGEQFPHIGSLDALGRSSPNNAEPPAPQQSSSEE